MKPTFMPTPKLTRSITFALLLSLASLVTAASTALADAPSCRDLFSLSNATAEAAETPPVRMPASPVGMRTVRALKTVQQIRMMAYNAKDMFLKLGRFAQMSLGNFEQITGAQPKSENELRGVAKAITDANPDFIVMEEVEDIESLTAFSNTYLANAYQAFLVDGNDQRSIQIGYLVKRDLPLQATIESHKEATWTDPNDGREHRLFSRDAPALMIRRQGASPNSKPALIFMGNHAKAQRDRDGDPRSTRLRTAQMNEIGSIIDDYQAQYGKDVPIVLGGDFNIDVRQAPDVQAIRDRMIDPFDAKKVQGTERVTHTFHPRNGRTQFSQLDALFVTPSLADNVVDIAAYRYKTSNGQLKPLPQTYEERSQNPSDHFPVIMTLSTEEIFPEAFQKAN